MRLTNKILEGLTVGVRQTSGMMSVYPLIGNDLNIDMAKFEDIEFLGNRDYGEMRFLNHSNKPFILPTCHCIMTKQKAQDHSTTFATVLDNGFNLLENACCIQRTQCGFIDGEKLKNDNETFSFLPLEIRRNVMFNISDSPRKEMDFARLWESIISFQKDLVKENNGNLIYFYTKFLSDLSRFNAEFELVENQRGAIITFNEEIVGIEITPTHDYFSHIWQPLIRDSYGASLIKMVKTNIEDSFYKSDKLDLSNCNNLKEVLYNIHEDYLTKQVNLHSNILKIEELDFEDKVSQNTFVNENSKYFKYKLMVDKDKNYGTEFFVNKDQIIYLSLIKNIK